MLVKSWAIPKLRHWIYKLGLTRRSSLYSKIESSGSKLGPIPALAVVPSGYLSFIHHGDAPKKLDVVESDKKILLPKKLNFICSVFGSLEVPLWWDFENFVFLATRHLWAALLSEWQIPNCHSENMLSNQPDVSLKKRYPGREGRETGTFWFSFAFSLKQRHRPLVYCAPL